MPAAVTAPNPSPYTFNKKGRYNAIWDAGAPEFMRLGQSLIKKRPVEHTTFKHLCRPDDPEFIPAPASRHHLSIPSDHLYCFKCQKYLAPERFHKDPSRPSRNGRDTRCKTCKKAQMTKREAWRAITKTSLPISSAAIE